MSNHTSGCSGCACYTTRSACHSQGFDCAWKQTFGTGECVDAKEVWRIVGPIIGGLFVFFLLCWCYRRRKARQLMLGDPNLQVNNNNNINENTRFGSSGYDNYNNNNNNINSNTAVYGSTVNVAADTNINNMNNNQSPVFPPAGYASPAPVTNYATTTNTAGFIPPPGMPDNNMYNNNNNNNNNNMYNQAQPGALPGFVTYGDVSNNTNEKSNY